MLDMCSLCTNILQEEEIEIVCRHYEERYQSNLPIPTSYIFGGLNATYFRRKLIQIQLQTLRTDTRHLQWAPIWRFTLSRSFFMAHFDKQLLHASPYEPFLCKRFRHIPSVDSS